MVSSQRLLDSMPQRKLASCLGEKPQMYDFSFLYPAVVKSVMRTFGSSSTCARCVTRPVTSGTIGPPVGSPGSLCSLTMEEQCSLQRSWLVGVSRV